MINFIKQNKIIVIIIITYFLIFATYSGLRHYTFQTQTWDMAVFEQSFWNTTQGKLMWNNFEGKNHFAIHFSPFLLLLVPLYAVWPSPYNLLIIQTSALAVAALPLYLLAKKILDKKWAIIITCLYFLYPSLHWVNLFDFHEVSFAIPLILTIFYFLEKKRFRWSSVFLILAASVSENMIMAVFFIGLYVLILKNRKYGSIVTILSFIYFILVSTIIMPALDGGIVRLDRYSQFGQTVPEIITNAILKPSLTLQTIFTSAKMFYLLKIFLPVAFLPLIAWQTLILLVPGLIQNLLTNYESQFINFYQYDSILIPFIFIGVIFGLKKILAKEKASRKIILPTITLLTLIGFLWNSPLSHFNFPLAKFTHERIEPFKQIVTMIPDDASVAAYTNLVPHLTHRDHIYMAGHEPFLVDYAIINSEDIFDFPNEESLNQYLKIYQETNQYEILSIDDKYFILKRNE